MCVCGGVVGRGPWDPGLQAWRAAYQAWDIMSKSEHVYDEGTPRQDARQAETTLVNYV